LKRIGIFGGTFNPVHTAHLILAEYVREQVHLEKVLFIPSANPPHKDHNNLVDAAMRLEMIRLATEGNPNFEPSDIEIRNSQHSKSYTVDTLLALREKYEPESAKLYLIIGMDNLAELHTWKEPGKLFSLAEVVVISRPGFYMQEVKNDFSGQVTYIPGIMLDISSTDIRERVCGGRSIKYLVPEKVEQFIYKNNLYKS